MRTMKRFMTEVLAALLICSMVVALQPAYAADKEAEALKEVAVTAEATDEAVVLDAAKQGELKAEPVTANGDDVIIAKASISSEYELPVGSLEEYYEYLSPDRANVYWFTATKTSMIVTVSNDVINGLDYIGAGLIDTSYNNMTEQQTGLSQFLPMDYNSYYYIRYDGLTVGNTYGVVILNPTGASSSSGKVQLRVSPTSLASYTVSITNRVYNGKSALPTTKLYYKDKTTVLESGQAYTRSGSRKTVGSQTLTITAKAPFTGKVTKKYKVIPKKPTISTSKSKIYYSGSSKKYVLKWSKVSSQATGYQIKYSKKSSFASAKTVTIKSYKTTSKTLKLKGYYYFKMRTYKTVNGVKYYSNWSNAVQG